MASWIVPGVFAAALGSFVADRWGFSPVFLTRFGLEALRLLLIIWLLQETLSRVKSGISLGELKGVMARIVVPPRELRGFYWARPTASPPSNWE